MCLRYRKSRPSAGSERISAPAASEAQRPTHHAAAQPAQPPGGEGPGQDQQDQQRHEGAAHQGRLRRAPQHADAEPRLRLQGNVAHQEQRGVARLDPVHRPPRVVAAEQGQPVFVGRAVHEHHQLRRLPRQRAQQLVFAELGLVGRQHGEVGDGGRPPQQVVDHDAFGQRHQRALRLRAAKVLQRGLEEAAARVGPEGVGGRCRRAPAWRTGSRGSR